jgi:maleylpyruvate isomerase
MPRPENERKQTDETFVLHSFFRSSTSFRVRAALNLKRLSYRQITHDFRKDEQRAQGYLAINPQGLVPTLCVSGEFCLSQSLAIIEWLDEVYPEPSLIPGDAEGRARVRALAQIVAMDIHPINNLRVLNALRERFSANDAAVADWFRHWAELGMDAFEEQLTRSTRTGRFCHGNTITLADICLVSQAVSNRRFGINPETWPEVNRIVGACLEREEFQAALPDAQPDATK